MSEAKQSQSVTHYQLYESELTYTKQIISKDHYELPNGYTTNDASTAKAAALDYHDEHDGREWMHKYYGVLS